MSRVPGTGNEGDAMHWTTTPPTDPGWYWVRKPDGEPEILRFERYESGLSAYDIRVSADGRVEGLFSVAEWPNDTMWAGPIPMPEESPEADRLRDRLAKLPAAKLDEILRRLESEDLV